MGSTVFFNISKRNKMAAHLLIPDKVPPADLIVLVASRRLEPAQTFKTTRMVFCGL
jgi:hypothetical protein